MFRESYTLHLRCDASHAPDDQSGHRDVLAPSREAAIEEARDSGWLIGDDGSSVCPFHAQSSDGRALPTAGPDRTHFVRSLVTDVAHGRVGGSAARVSRGVGTPVVVVAPTDTYAAAIGVLVIFENKRTWDRIVPPGATSGDAPGTILSDRVPIHGSLQSNASDSRLRTPLLAAFGNGVRADAIRAWLDRRSLEWWIARPDVWASLFANVKDRFDFLRAAPESVDPDFAAYHAAAMTAFASIIATASPTQLGRMKDF